jgi:hypothetical protein
LLVYLVEAEKDIYIGVLVLICHLATHLVTWNQPSGTFQLISVESGERLF